MTQEIALLIVAGVVGLGLLILAVSIFSVAKAIRKILPSIEEWRSVHHMMLEDGLKLERDRLELERNRFAFDRKEKEPRIVLLKTANLKLFEEKQELAVGYSIENLGKGKILITKLQVALINKRTPNLIKIIEMIFNQVVDDNRPYVGEVLITAKDFTRVSLPFVPDFSFIKDSCEIVASLEYENSFGETLRIDKDILEW